MSSDLELCFATAKVVENTPHSGFHALLQYVAGLPPQLAADQHGVNRITAFVAGAVAHQVYQARVAITTGINFSGYCQ